MANFDKFSEDMNKVFQDMDKVFKDMDKVFADRSRETWAPYKLWWPKRIKDKWYWPTETVYRKFVMSPGGGFWVYGDDFDMLRDIK